MSFRLRFRAGLIVSVFNLVVGFDTALSRLSASFGMLFGALGFSVGAFRFVSSAFSSLLLVYCSVASVVSCLAGPIIWFSV